MKTTILTMSNPINDSLLRCAVILISFALMFIAFLPKAGAVSPPPDGGYPGSNTAEGDGALQSLTSGLQNTAVGFEALFSDTAGSNNTAIGIGALLVATRPAIITRLTVTPRLKTTQQVSSIPLSAGIHWPLTQPGTLILHWAFKPAETSA